MKKMNKKELPTIPANAMVLNNQYQPNSVTTGNVYHLPAGSVLNLDDINMSSGHTLYYISGELNVKNIYGNSATVYVMPGGRLKLNMAIIPTGLTVYAYGDIEFKNIVKLNRNCSIQFDNVLTVSNIEIGGRLYVAGAFNASSLISNNDSKVEFGGCANVLGTIVFDNNSEIKVHQYVSASKIDLKQNAKVMIASGAFIETNTLEMNHYTTRIECQGNEYAGLDLNKLIIHTFNAEHMFIGWLNIKMNTFTNHSGEDNAALLWNSNVIINNPNIYIPANGCHAAMGIPSAPENNYRLDMIASLAPPTTNISATSIFYYHTKAYVSWHVKGDPFAGYVDILNATNRELEQTTLSGATDYNHIAVHQNKLYVAGGSFDKGGLCAVLNLGADGLVSDPEQKIVKAQGASGNCVVGNGNDIMIASGNENGAFEVYNISTLDKITTHPAQAAKYIEVANGKIVTLSGITNPQISIYNLTDSYLETPLNQFNIASINPGNGKNVCRFDGEKIYVCLGDNGLKVYNLDGTLSVVSPIEHGSANCVDFDDQYIYVANGVAGIYVLDKATMQLRASYKRGNTSANFIKKGNDGYLYVAYGTDGVQIYKLIVD